MANQETQLLDEVIAKGRRKMLSVGLTSLAGAFSALWPGHWRRRRVLLRIPTRIF